MRKFLRVWLFTKDVRREWVGLAAGAVIFCFHWYVVSRAGIRWELLRLVLELLLILVLFRPVIHFLILPLSLVVGSVVRFFDKEPTGTPCPVCGYDISMTLHRCPECGTKLQWGQLPDSDQR